MLCRRFRKLQREVLYGDSAWRSNLATKRNNSSLCKGFDDCLGQECFLPCRLVDPKLGYA